MSNFIDERHNLYVGWVLGIALKHGLPVKPVIDDKGNYTARLIFHLPESGDLTLVVPEPPEEWPAEGSTARGHDHQREIRALPVCQ